MSAEGCQSLRQCRITAKISSSLVNRIGRLVIGLSATTAKRPLQESLSAVHARIRNPTEQMNVTSDRSTIRAAGRCPTTSSTALLNDAEVSQSTSPPTARTVTPPHSKLRVVIASDVDIHRPLIA